MIEAAILEHAKETFPKESCGAVIRTDEGMTYVRCRNIADGDNEFIFHPVDYASAEDAGELLALVHSHPDMPAEMSEADKEAFAYSTVDWIIVSCQTEEIRRFAIDCKESQ